MARQEFSIDSFLQANKESTEGAGGDGFPDIENGLYIGEIVKSYIQNTKAGAQMAHIVFRLTEENDSNVGQWVWWSQNLVTRDGRENMLGLKGLNSMLTRLHEGDFDPHQFCKDFTIGMEKVIGIECRIKIKQDGKWEGKTQYDIKLAQVLTANKTMPKKEVANTEEKFEMTNEAVESTAPVVVDTSAENNLDSEEVTLDSKIKYEAITDKGRKIIQYGKVVSYIEGNNEQAGILMVQRYLDTDFDKPFGLPLAVMEDNPALALCHINDVIVSEEDVIEETSNRMTFKVGQVASYVWRGDILSGEIHAIDEDEGIIKMVAENEDGKKVARSIAMDDFLGTNSQATTEVEEAL